MKRCILVPEAIAVVAAAIIVGTTSWLYATLFPLPRAEIVDWDGTICVNEYVPWPADRMVARRATLLVRLRTLASKPPYVVLWNSETFEGQEIDKLDCFYEDGNSNGQHYVSNAVIAHIAKN